MTGETSCWLPLLVILGAVIAGIAIRVRHPRGPDRRALEWKLVQQMNQRHHPAWEVKNTRPMASTQAAGPNPSE